MRRSIIHAGVSAFLVAGLALACGGKSPDDEEFGNGTRGGDSEFDEGLSGQSDVYGEDASGGLSSVYFEYDRWDIGSESASKLQGNAQAIQGRGFGTVTIEGHTDERGSEEYNLALGEKRANAVKRYLVDLGVSSSSLSPVSFGESQPAVQGHDESAWRYNRRADFRVGR